VSDDLRHRLVRAASRAGARSSDFDLSPDLVLPANRVLKPAAVMIPVTGSGEVILTTRSARLKHHPGQVAFPGGRQDPEDATLAETALRETEEEIGLGRNSVEILGELATHETVTAYRVTPFLALVDAAAPLRPEAGEVAEVFRVPLEHLADPAHYAIEARRWQGRWRRYYTVPWGPYYIWGATARMLRALAERLSQ